MPKDFRVVSVDTTSQDFRVVFTTRGRLYAAFPDEIQGLDFPIHFVNWAPLTAASEVSVDGPDANSPPPPRRAELLLHYVLPRARRVEVLGDLEEDYQQEWLPKYGPHHARRMYWRHALRSITPLLWMAIKRWGLITLILGAADWLRDRLG
jgi:hypothetical protein